MKKVLIVVAIIATLVLAACAPGASGSPKNPAELISKMESLTSQMSAAVKAGDMAKVEALTKDFESIETAGKSFKDSDFTPEQKAQMEKIAMEFATAMFGSLGGLGDALKGLGEGLGESLGDALGEDLTGAPTGDAPATGVTE